MEMCVRKGMELAMEKSFPSPCLFASSVTGKVIQAVFIAWETEFWSRNETSSSRNYSITSALRMPKANGKQNTSDNTSSLSSIRSIFFKQTSVFLYSAARGITLEIWWWNPWKSERANQRHRPMSKGTNTGFFPTSLIQSFPSFVSFLCSNLSLTPYGPDIFFVY